MAFRILRKKKLVKKQKLLWYNLTQERSVILDWSLMQLAALEQTTNLKISLDAKPVWLKKNLGMSVAQFRENRTFYFWNMSLFSTSMLGTIPKLGFYRNLKLFREPCDGNFRVNHLGVDKLLYASWLAVYLRSSFFSKRGRRLSTVILTNILFYDSLIPLTYEKFYFINELESLQVGSFWPTIPLILPFSVRSLYNILYPFFLVIPPFFSKLNYHFARYFRDWQQSIVYSEGGLSSAETSYAFFSVPPFRLNLLRKRHGGLSVVEQIRASCLGVFESADVSVMRLVNEVEEELEASVLLGEEQLVGEGAANVVESKILVDMPYSVHLGWFINKQYWDFKQGSVVLEHLYALMKTLKLDTNLRLKSAVCRASGWEATNITYVKSLGFNLKNFNYSNITSPFWLLLIVGWVSIFAGFRLFSFFSFCGHTFFEDFKWKRLWPAIFVSYLFYIRIAVRDFLFKKSLKGLIILDLMSLIRTHLDYLLVGVRAVVFCFFLFWRFNIIAYLCQGAFMLIFLILLLGLIWAGIGSLKIFFLILFAEAALYSLYRYFVTYVRFASPRMVDELLRLFFRPFDFYMQWLKIGRRSVFIFITFNVLYVSSFLIGGWRKIGAELTVYLTATNKQRSGRSIISDLFAFRYIAKPWLVQVLFIKISKRCYEIFRKSSITVNFFDVSYLLLLCNSVAVFWIYFSFFFIIFGEFGWWLSATFSSLPMSLMARAVYFSKLLQRSLIPGYYTLAGSLVARSRGITGVVVAELLLIRNYLNPQIWAVIFSEVLVSPVLNKVTTSLRLNQVFADIFGEQLLGVALSSKQLSFFISRAGFSFFYKKNTMLTQHFWVVPFKALSFFGQILIFFARFCFVVPCLFLILLLTWKCILWFWVVAGFAVLKFFWLCIFGTLLYAFFRKCFLF